MAATSCGICAAVSSLSSTIAEAKSRGPICSFPRSDFSTPNLSFNPSRLRLSHKIGIVPKHGFWDPLVVSCLGDNHSEASSSESALSSDSKEEATVDLKLPRRSLLVHFTCNGCGERTQKLINRLAYERGTVFVQTISKFKKLTPCPLKDKASCFTNSSLKTLITDGCLQHHKLIDNLGLVVEYDFREDSGMDSNGDQV